MTWRIADQLVCFKRILIYSDLKYDPPRRPREMRIIDPRRSIMRIIRHQTGKNFLPSDVYIDRTYIYSMLAQLYPTHIPIFPYKSISDAPCSHLFHLLGPSGGSRHRRCASESRALCRSGPNPCRRPTRPRRRWRWRRPQPRPSGDGSGGADWKLKADWKGSGD